MAGDDRSAPLHVTYILHDTQRGGASVMLARTVRWINDNSALIQAAVSREPGPLYGEFAALMPMTVVPHWDNWTYRLIRKSPRHLGLMRFRVPGARDLLARADVVYSNSTRSAELFDLVPDRVPILAHLHEMPLALRRSGTPGELAALAERPSHYLVPSEAAARGVVEVLGAAPGRVTIARPFVDSMRPRASFETTEALRRSLGIEADTLLVGGAGRFDLAKGFDLFPDVCALVTQQVTAHFVWLGRGDDYTMGMFERDLRLRGIADRVNYLEEVDDPHDWFSAFDVLCLPSREDSFPLVAVENAALGNPVVCFKEGGGASEYIDEAAGAAVPYLDLDAMAAAIVELADPDVRAQRGRVARDRASHFTAGSVCPVILDAIARIAR